jgi:hypothetical protein
MAVKEKSNIMLYILSIPAFLYTVWSLFVLIKNMMMQNKVAGLFSKDESKIRKQRDLYKKTLNEAILKAASRIKEKSSNEVSLKDEEIRAYKDEESKEEKIKSYKKE